MRLRKKPWIAEAVQDLKDEYIYLGDAEKQKGKWSEVFGDKKISLEIGSGKGRFINGMAKIYPDKAFVGVESQSDIAYYPAKMAKDEELTNVKIISGDAMNMLDWFEPGEVSELYLNFSDPWPKVRHARRRLTHRGFLELYKKILGPGGHLRFKTDNRPLFDFSVEEFREFGVEIIALSYDLHKSEYENEVQTEYEEKFSALGNKINFCEIVF